MYDFIVPQELNIADRIGKFTFPQLGFLAGGMLIVMILFITSSIPMWVSILIGIPIMLGCLILAFFKKYEMPMYEYLLVLVLYKTLPKEMIYSATETQDEIYEFEEDEEEIEELILI
jgi:hypothetical protein